jgi:hypothetical protein
VKVLEDLGGGSGNSVIIHVNRNNVLSHRSIQRLGKPISKLGALLREGDIAVGLSMCVDGLCVDGLRVDVLCVDALC